MKIKSFADIDRINAESVFNTFDKFVNSWVWPIAMGGAAYIILRGILAWLK